jgi:hypothetical protein
VGHVRLDQVALRMISGPSQRRQAGVLLVG